MAMCLSTYSTTSLEDVIAQGTGNPYAMQVSFFSDAAVTHQLIKRAESKLTCGHEYRKDTDLQLEAGYKALFVSVDLPVLGNRISEKRNSFCFPPHLTFPNIHDESEDLMKYYGAGYGTASLVRWGLEC